MCDASYSEGIALESEGFLKADSALEKNKWIRQRRALHAFDAVPSPEQWEAVRSNIVQSAESVWFVGGEPLLIDEVRKTLVGLLEKATMRRITVGMSTNLQFFNEDIIDLMNQPDWHYSRTNIGLDGVGNVFEYVRHLGNWELLEKNIHRLLSETRHIQICFSVVLQAYNILHFTDILRWIELLPLDHRVSVAVSVLKNPPQLQYLSLGRAKICDAAEKLQGYLKNAELTLRWPNLQERLQGILNHLRHLQTLAPAMDANELTDFTQTMDGLRNTQWRDM